MQKQIVYALNHQPIKKASVVATGGRDVILELSDSKERMMISLQTYMGGETLTASFDKNDIGEFIELLSNMHEQM